MIILVNVDDITNNMNITDEYTDDHIYVKNYMKNYERMEDVLGQLGNRVITLKDGHRGIVSKAYRCYGSSSVSGSTSTTVKTSLLAHDRVGHDTVFAKNKQDEYWWLRLIQATLLLLGTLGP
jgi:hypothetical protein